MLRRLLLAAIAAACIAPTLGIVPAAAVNDPDGDPNASQLALQLRTDDQDVTATAQLSQQIAAESPKSFVLQLDRALREADAQQSFLGSIRAEQTDIYLLAGDPATEHAVEAQLPPSLAAQVQDTAGALRALWRLGGVDDIRGIRPHFVRDPNASLPIPELLSLYSSAAGQYGMDWTYLAAINYIETDFGRVLGPSVTGAEGPMQFEPDTWTEYGAGSVMSPHDAIQAAALYLNTFGAPGDMASAIYAYNPTWDYVEAVARLAAVVRRDRTWYTRLYYWSTKAK